MNEIQEIEAIAKKILVDNKSQTCGTEWQKWSYALIKAREQYEAL
jgi:hypothetical protein